MEFIKLLTGTAKTLISNKSVQQILKYIAATTLTYASKKYNIAQYKYDINDNRNMVYQHNMNNDDIIDPLLSDQAANLYKIDRFINELKAKKIKDNEDVTGLSLDSFLNCLALMTNNDRGIFELKDAYHNNPRLLNFDYDTLETSSIADSYEINSGGIYVPIKNIELLTQEGQHVAKLKNEYLEKRVELGETSTEEEVYKLLQEYHKKNKTKEIYDYYSNFM